MTSGVGLMGAACTLNFIKCKIFLHYYDHVVFSAQYLQIFAEKHCRLKKTQNALVCGCNIYALQVSCYKKIPVSYVPITAGCIAILIN